VDIGLTPTEAAIPSVRHPWIFCPDTSSKHGVLSRDSELSDLYHHGRVHTIYKRKADKVRPVDWHVSDGSTPGGRPDWKERAMQRQKLAMPTWVLGPYDHLFEPRYTSEAAGYRLTPARLKDVLVGITLSALERQMFEAMLVTREPALS
jgi:hypothetical protein